MPAILTSFATLALAAAAARAWAAEPLDTRIPAAAAEASCADCGVVRSVKLVTKQIKPDDSKVDPRPSGLVATMPFGGKMEAGPSQRLGKDAVMASDSWEVIVRLDDGRFRVLTLREQPDVKAGDKVRIEANGRLTPRGN
jgi:hypothetical protein